MESHPESNEDIHGWDWEDANQAPLAGLPPPDEPSLRLQSPSRPLTPPPDAAPSPGFPGMVPAATPTGMPGGLRVRRTGFNTYHLTGDVPMGRTRPEGDGREATFNGLNSVFQLLQHATAPPANTGSRTMRFTSPSMNATVTVQSRTFGSGTSPRPRPDTTGQVQPDAAGQMAEHELDNIHQ
jgi:hypothetical protein